MIRDLPAGERPRERLWNEGPGALADRELLALLLRSGRSGESALGVADQLLADRGGLPGLAKAIPEELSRLSGVGRTKAGSLVAAFELARRLGRSPTADSETFRRPEQLAGLVSSKLSGISRETLLVVVLNGAHRVRRVLTVSVGSIERSLVPVREILNAVLRNDGRAFALAHNHPSGDVAPSPQDIESTREIARAAEVVGLRFVDHLVVAESGWTSMRESGLL